MVSEMLLQEAVNELVLNGGSKTAAADKFGVAHSTYRGWLKQAERNGIFPTVIPPNAQAEILKIKLKYEAEIRSLTAQLKEALREKITVEHIREQLFPGVGSESRPKVAWANKQHTGGFAGVPHLFLSDFHWAETVRPEESGGNEYNLEIARRRLVQTVENAFDVLFNHVKDPAYPGLVLLLGGDMVGGNIHEELAVTNQIPILPTVLDLFDHLVAAIDRGLEHFDHIAIYTKYGNHGRISPKKGFKNVAYDNYDWMLYCMLERHYANDARVEIHNDTAFDVQFTAGGISTVLTHGDRMGTSGGTGMIGPIAPILRGASKVKNKYINTGIKVDCVAMGHWHTYMPLMDVMVNGTLKGQDELGESYRFVDNTGPCQSLWLNHPKHGRVGAWPIYSK